MKNQEILAGERVREIRKSFTLSIFGLSMRDETLFKSLLRLLQNTTRHKWVYAPEGQDLYVLGPNYADEIAQSSLGSGTESSNSAALMWVGHESRKPGFHTALPLHYKEIEASLNEIGDWIEAKAIKTAVAAPRAHTEHVMVEPDESVQLTRWPPVVFLTTPQRAKTAALLLKAPMKISSLARRVGMPLEECQVFVTSLPHLVRSLPSESIFGTSNAVGLPTQKLTENDYAKPNAGILAGARRSLTGTAGLLARIREKLGLK